MQRLIGWQTIRAGHEAAHLASVGVEKTKEALAAGAQRAQEAWTDVKEHVKGQARDTAATREVAAEQDLIDKTDAKLDDVRLRSLPLFSESTKHSAFFAIVGGAKVGRTASSGHHHTQDRSQRTCACSGAAGV